MSERWRLGPHRWDWLRSVRCLIVGHEWTVNPRRTQAVCYRCWTVEDRRSADA
jgi:hypothetical protein